MRRSRIKDDAQDCILRAADAAKESLKNRRYNLSWEPEYAAEVIEEIDRQLARVEKLFGLDPRETKPPPWSQFGHKAELAPNGAEPDELEAKERDAE